MLPGLDAVPLKREFKRLMKRSVSATIALLFEANSSAEARATLGVRSDGERTAAAGGTADAITATFSPNITALTDGLRVRVTGLSSNATTTPTLTAGTTAATTIKLFDGTPIKKGEMPAEGDFIYSSASAAWLLQNPRTESPFEFSAVPVGNAMVATLKAGGWFFRNATLGTGGFEYVKTDTDLTLTISSGSTLGTVNAVQSEVLARVVNDAGTLRLTAENIAGGMDASETGLISTTAEGGAGAADSATVIYSGTAVASKAYRVAGVARSTQATAGTWTSAPSLVQGSGGHALKGLSASNRFVSAEQTITGNSVLNVAHGLGFVPSMVRVTLRCKTAEFNYVADDEVEVNYNYGPGVQYTSVASNATNVSIILQGAQPTVLNKSTQALQNITLANWRWVVRAWL